MPQSVAVNDSMRVRAPTNATAAPSPWPTPALARLAAAWRKNASETPARRKHAAAFAVMGPSPHSTPSRDGIETPRPSKTSVAETMVNPAGRCCSR
jgi:hypothetical protein